MKNCVNTRIPAWLDQIKNEWHSSASLGRIFAVDGGDFNSWFRCAKSRLPSNRGRASNGHMVDLYKVKTVWAACMGAGLEVIMPPSKEDCALEQLSIELEDTRRMLLAATAREKARTDEIKRLMDLRRDELEKRHKTSPAMLVPVWLLEKLITAKPPTPNAGVYFLLKAGRVVYVGQSGNVLARMAGHTRKDFDECIMVEIDDKEGRLEIETQLIACMSPACNIRGRIGCL